MTDADELLFHPEMQLSELIDIISNCRVYYGDFSDEEINNAIFEFENENPDLYELIHKITDRALHQKLQDLVIYAKLYKLDGMLVTIKNFARKIAGENEYFTLEYPSSDDEI